MDKILHLKQSSNSITQFSDESHQLKAKLLLQPLASNTLKQLAGKTGVEPSE